MTVDPSPEEMRAELEAMRVRLGEAEETLDAIRKGEVDAVVVAGADGHRVYTLEGAEQFYRLLIEAMQQGAATLSVDGTILYCNRSFAAMLDVPQEKVGGASFADYLAPTDRGFWQSLLRQGCVSREQGEARIRSRTGTLLPVLLSLNALPLEGAVALGLVVTDLTEQKRHEETARQLMREEAAREAAEETAREARRAEKAVRESETRLRRLADALPQIVWMARPHGYVDYYNQRWYEFTGAPSGEVGDESWLRILHPDDVEPTRKTWDEVVKSGGIYQVEYRFRDRSTGGYRWYLGRAIPVRDDEAHIVRWFGTCTDIHEQKRAEESSRFLAQASAALATLVDYESTLQKVATIAVPYFADWSTVDMVKDDGSVRRLAIAHLDPAKIEFLRALDRTYPYDSGGSGTVGRILRTGKSEIVEEVSPRLLSERTRDDRHCELLQTLGLKSFICVPLLVSGKPIGVLTFATAESGRSYTVRDLAVAEDLAHRAAIAVENSQLYRALKDADRKKDEFLAVLAHELRNPLAPIRNALQILRLTTRNDATASSVQHMMERQVEQMVRLVDDLLDVSRITRGKIELRKELLDVANIVAGAVETSRPTIEAAKHALTIVPSLRQLRVDGDGARLTQVLSNLLTNAAKYTPEGGRISLTVDERDAEVVIRVRDNGMGIPAEMLPKIFDMFTQVDSNLGRSQGGLGIGLTLVRSLVEMHQGTVRVHSDGPDRGSEFSVHLPLASSAQPDDDEEIATDVSTTVAALTARRILVVDDNVDSAESLGMMLELLGNEIRTTHDGAGALKEADAFLPGVILLDIGLPGMDGYEVARRIRTMPSLKNVVLIAQTGWGQEEDRRRSAEAGFNYHLVKPIDPVELQALLAGLPPPTA